MVRLKTKRSCKLLHQTNSPSCKLSCSQLVQPLLSIILVSSIAGSAVAETETGVLTITDANWMVTMDGEWMIKFVAPWCPACAQLKEHWERFSSLAAAMGVSVGEVDVTEQPGLSGRFLVTTLPTIFHVKEGSVRRYVSVREAEEFHAYISNRRWEEVEPLPSWKSPTSPLMSCMAGLFRLSLWIRRTHGYLTGDLGMPVWGSYLSFAMATLVTGLLMGLVLVLVADCLCPSRQKRKEERAATQAAGTGMMLSSWATSTIEEVRSSAGNGLLWMQLYIYKDRDLTLSLVRRAEEAGYKAIFVTVDTPYLGKRRDDVRNRFKLPPHLKMTNFGSAELAFSSAEGYGEDSGLAVYVAQAIDPTLCWEHIAWLKKNTHLPVVVKGVLRAEDASEALNHGVDGILVSNHGARQLDGVPATLDVLSEVVSAVAGRCEVYLDGGVRRGTDVLKALALGATAVFLGRPVLWGLACQGEQGVSDVLELMRDELHLAMALAGCCSLVEVNRSLVRRPEFTSRI